VFLIEELVPAPDPAGCCGKFLDLPYLVFLDGQGGPADLARYSYLTADPWEVVRGQTRETIRIDCRRGTERTVLADPMDVLEEALEPWRFPQYPGLPPFQGGLGRRCFKRGTFLALGADRFDLGKLPGRGAGAL